MPCLLDTNVVIHLRDGDDRVAERIAQIDDAILISIITRIELEGGVHREPEQAALRRRRLDAILEALPMLAFDSASADAYRTILEATGFSRRRVLDRMIASQALVHGASLATLNAADFRDVPGLRLLEW